MRHLDALRRGRQPLREWPETEFRELGSEQLDESPAQYRIVACLNVWNDLPALQETLPTWIDHVDHVIAVDGSYAMTETLLSTDGTREFLDSLPKVHVVGCGHTSQLEKRTRYLELGQPNDLLFVVDADESVQNAACLRETPWMDVGWVRVKSGLYARSYGQPRCFRWQPGMAYRGRHHWMYVGEQLLATHQYGGVGFDHRIVPLTIENRRGLGHTPVRHAAKVRHAASQFAEETPIVAAKHTALSDRKMSRREALRICMAAQRDDGMAVSRLHTAINKTTPHSSVLFKAQEGPYGVPEAYKTSGSWFHRAIQGADIVHFHVNVLADVTTSSKQLVVLHNHGTQLRDKPAYYQAQATQRDALWLVSNLELLSYTEGKAEFLPNVMPVARYQRLRNPPRTSLEPGVYTLPVSDGYFRVAHSPSVRSKKGTEEFLKVCTALKERGYPIEPVLIEGKPHGEALALKATCDACFDSFWLGMQCSGLEAAAMGMPVLAGDEVVAHRHIDLYGAVPYTFAPNAEGLEFHLAQMMDDPAYRQKEAERVFNHVLEFHDESAVALRYLDLLDLKWGWRS